jgi:lysophospholipase L1-like esterase
MSLIKRNHIINLLVVFISLVFCLVVLLFAEGTVRVFSNINFLGDSPNLFIVNAYGTSKGNARNSEEISFGAKVYTDEHGFRIVNKADSYKQNYKKSVLILGDSVGFGTGVLADKTFAGLLSINQPSLKVYNSSVIGYSVDDYKNIIDNFYLKHNGINKVFLVFCLNDVSSASAKMIDAALKNDVATDNEEKVIDVKEDAKASLNIIESLRSINIISATNEFLRSQSKLYLLIKGAVTKPQQRYWEADYLNYKNATTNSLAATLKPIVYIRDILRKNQVEFKIIIAPYEFQLRSNDESTRLPQKMLAYFFESEHIDYIDAIPFFNNRGLKSQEFFLPYDPMHFSEVGHEVIYEIIREALEQG